MSIDLARLRRFAPLAVFAVTVALGWVLLLSSVVADGTSVEDRIALLRQREAALQAMLTEPSPVVVAPDPLAAFDARVSAEDQTASVVERLARLASDARARGLFIETVEGTNAGGRGAPPVAATYRPDPRFALFDRQVAYTTIRMSFESDYSSLGQLLWNFRDLPSIVEVRTLNVQARVRAPSGSARTDGTVRTSMTLFAYSRTSPARPADTAVTR